MSQLIAATPRRLVALGLVGRWSARSQEQARRNAMAACTVLAARRLERLEVEAFVSEYRARREAQRLARHTAEAAPAPMRGVG